MLAAAHQAHIGNYQHPLPTSTEWSNSTTPNVNIAQPYNSIVVAVDHDGGSATQVHILFPPVWDL